MLEAFASAYGAELCEVAAHDPLMRPIVAHYGITSQGVAIIESAQACGLSLMSVEERAPLRATTYGVGEMVADAVRQGCRSFIVGLGGSGTSDAGMGMLKAIVDAFAPAGGHIDEVLSGQMSGCSFTLACDVDNPLCGPRGAAEVYGPQKGASRAEVLALDRRAGQFARMLSRENLLRSFRTGTDTLSLRHKQNGRDGKVHWVETKVVCTECSETAIRALLLGRCIDEEIEKQKLLEKTKEASRMAKQAEENYRILHKLIGSGMWRTELDENGRITGLF